MSIKKRCPECGASMMEHRHNLSRAMVEALRRLALRETPVNIKVLGLTRNQWDNFQKLRYWGLVQKAYADGSRIGGTWGITPRGREFLAGVISVPAVVWTYRGEHIRDESRTIHVTELLPINYKTRPEYAAEAQPHT